MLKHILLLTPVYVTIFWSIALNTKKGDQNNAQLFLGKFMLVACLIYSSHFLFFAPYPTLYFFIDPFYQYASLLSFPLYNIYIRLLTVDTKFSFKNHTRYIFIPTVLFLLYLLGILFTPANEYKLWVFDRGLESCSTGIHFLNVIDFLIHITFLIQVIITVVRGHLLVKKYGVKAMQFYSDINDSSTQKVKTLNFTMIVTGVAALILGALGRNFFVNELIGLGIASIVFSSMLYIVGWLGYSQKELNPTMNMIPEPESVNPQSIELSNSAQTELLQKIVKLFEDKKLYLHDKVNIQDVAQIIGTNRTYVSMIINQNFNQNFCCFVNTYRIAELEEVMQKYPEYDNQKLAQSCGFGSTDSLKRAVKAKYNLSLSEWKRQKQLGITVISQKQC